MTANPAGAATAVPGRAFRETLHERWAARGHAIDTRPWEALPEIDREDLNAAAQAAIATATVSALRACAENALSEADMTELRERLAEVVLTPGPALLRPASELGTAWRILGEARAERDRLREQLETSRDDFHFERKQVVVLREVLTEVFTCLNSADVSLLEADQVDEWRERAGIEDPPSAGFAGPDAAAGRDGS